MGARGIVSSKSKLKRDLGRQREIKDNPLSCECREGHLGHSSPDTVLSPRHMVSEQYVINNSQ